MGKTTSEKALEKAAAMLETLTGRLDALEEENAGLKKNAEGGKAKKAAPVTKGSLKPLSEDEADRLNRYATGDITLPAEILEDLETAESITFTVAADGSEVFVQPARLKAYNRKVDGQWVTAAGTEGFSADGLTRSTQYGGRCKITADKPPKAPKAIQSRIDAIRVWNRAHKDDGKAIGLLK